MLHGGTLTNPPSKAGIEGFAKGLSQIASVADATARAALMSGLTVTPASPVWVYRQDTGNVEMTTDGTTWRTIATGPTSSVTLTYAAGWGTADGAATVYREAGWAWMEGTIVRSASSDNSPFTIPAGYRPTRKVQFPVFTLNAANADGPDMQVRVESTGVVDIKYTTEASLNAQTWVRLASTPWRIGG